MKNLDYYLGNFQNIDENDVLNKLSDLSDNWMDGYTKNRDFISLVRTAIEGKDFPEKFDIVKLVEEDDADDLAFTIKQIVS